MTFSGLGLRIWVTPDDFDATADFYGDALGLKCTWRSAEAGIATYQIGFGPTIVVERTEPRPGGDARFGRFTGICLEVTDIEADYLALQARGVAFEGPPLRQHWGGVMAFFSDPAGNNHTLLQQPVRG